MIHVRMRDPWDCAICALASALEIPYEEASAGFPNPWRAINEREAIGNIFPEDVMQFLAQRGFGYQMSHPASTQPWPPEPFASVHVLWVKLPKNGEVEVDGKIVLPRHCVAWDGKIVLDSLQDAPRRLDNYPIIEFALGIRGAPIALECQRIPTITEGRSHESNTSAGAGPS